jgi:hypothetical protein
VISSASEVGGILLEHDHLDNLVTALSDNPQAIRFTRRPISRNTLSNKEMGLGAVNDRHHGAIP